MLVGIRRNEEVAPLVGWCDLARIEDREGAQPGQYEILERCTPLGRTANQQDRSGFERCLTSGCPETQLSVVTLRMRIGTGS